MRSLQSVRKETHERTHQKSAMGILILKVLSWLGLVSDLGVQNASC